MSNKKTMLYLMGFISQLVLVVAVFGVGKEMATFRFFIILSLAIAITLNRFLHLRNYPQRDAV